MTQTSVEVGSNTGTGTTIHEMGVRELSEAERRRVWNALRREIPHVDRFQANTERVIPIFELSRA